jgi:hypothetical protein
MCIYLSPADVVASPKNDILVGVYASEELIILTNLADNTTSNINNSQESLKELEVTLFKD